ncbi:polysaccharide deacetylase family protein [Microbulbifer sp. OS29]|uniref:Polysaccharide deacetylase family protein n=1 Tax=Microbulbifer okhotskensis TaxID=2926617 RepID=A0A9X2EPS9_9GAMM|nr:polysaccharide deacetylase family protein [Microbulbifer okhotskensis]MCO1335591.1 polysaccharide deacetylase family protein [Microbulbifer okhotskensis]
MKIIITVVCTWLSIFPVYTQATQASGKQIALIFDEGPVPGKTESLLKQLESLQITATFFPIGREMEKFPDQTQAIIAAGHQLGNHSYSHMDLAQMSLSSAKEEIKKTCRLLQRHGYIDKPMFLPPFGRISEELGTLLQDQNFKIAHWDLDPSQHLQQGDIQAAADYLSKNAKHGSVVLLHPMYDQYHQVIEALPLINAQLKAAGFHFVTLEQLTAD